MAERIFTPEQLSAIETRDKTLLVSAAAGSGKTATLTERIIRSLVNEDNPRDISRMLIVTFTNAAVDELRERITAALKKKLAEEPKNDWLARQLYMLPNAKISTIDAFCNDILKSNAERFGISPTYRIADPAEAGILAHSVLSSLILAAYNGDIDTVKPEDFEELSGCLVGAKNDSALEEIFSALYEKSKSHERGVYIFREFANKIFEYVSLPVEENPYGKFAMDRAKEVAQHYRELYTKLCARITHLTDADFAYVDFFEEERSYFDKVLRQNTYEDMREVLGEGFRAVPRAKKKGPLHEVLLTVRNEMKDALNECYDRYFSYSVDEWGEHLSKLYTLLTTLASFISEFDRIYFEEKKRRSVLEYSDIERLTYRALYADDGSLTELAYAQRELYSDVYVDEYQDVNSVQNKIFEAVSRADNRFMVGDIKQSIYGFRSARPDIFAEMKNEFSDLASAENSSAASIFMSKNFRSDKGILNFANDIFHPLFTLVKESIGYVPEDRLEYGKVNTGPLLAESEKRTPDVYLFTNLDKTEGVEKLSDLPPLWVAEKIKELTKQSNLTSGERIRASDIAIILRKDGGRARVYADALSKAGISARMPDSKSILDNSEIQLVLCLLSAIDNPMRDIYLAGLMMSPLYDFTPDELYKIKKFGGGTNLWDSLKSYSEAESGFTKGAQFIETLDHYRAIAEGIKVDALIMRLYNETGLLALAAKNECKENLMLLYNYARKFEASSFEGLFSFINYINKLIESGAGFSAPKASDEEDAVTIITAHKSKGLEFPVVFLADAATSLYSNKDKTARVAFSDTLGIAMKTRIPNGLSLVESPVYNAIIDSGAERSLEEELRVYYVALTRARERLYITGAVNSKNKEAYLTGAKINKTHIDRYTLKQAKSFVDIMLLFETDAKITWNEDASSCENDFEAEYEDSEERSELALPEIHWCGAGNLDREDKKLPAQSAEINTDTGIVRVDKEIGEEKEQKASATEEELRAALTERLSYEYPRIHLTTLPQKMSISKLYPTVLDGSDENISLSIDDLPQQEAKAASKLPEFITGTGEYESAMRGIATHTFLQFFELQTFLPGDSKKELERLVKKNFLSAKDAERVRLDEIELFAKSELLFSMKKAKKLYREFRFNVMLPASLFTANEEKRKALEGRKILLQGVIDCLIEDNDGNLHLVDYKTDRLTADELKDKSLAQKKLSEKHSLQLTYYSYAVEKIFSKKPATVSIYSLPLGDTVEISV